MGEIELRGGERIVRSGAANHWRGSEAVGGKLYVTTQRIVFVPHGMNIQKGIASYDVSAISRVERSGFLRNQLTVDFADGGSERFVVFRATGWLRLIESLGN